MLHLPSWNEKTTVIAVGIVTFLGIAAKFRKEIRSRMEQLNLLKIVRIDTSEAHPTSSKMKQMELNPDFVKECVKNNECPQMMSLGQYLASLRPNLTKGEELPDFLETAVENVITRALMHHLGPKLGKAILPLTGTSFVQDAVSNLVGKFIIHASSATDKDRIGAVPFSLIAIPGVAQLNYEFFNKPKVNISADPLHFLQGGEVDYSPSFSEIVTPPATDDDLLVPNPFIISIHWDRAISKMEDLIVAASEPKWKSTKESNDDDGSQQSGTFVYNADSKAMAPPKPLDERLLPDLYLGWGSAQCTHTQEEILKNRLLSVLLNRLASNYYYTDEAPFQVLVDESSKTMTRPTELMQALIDMGHTVESCVRSNITTFGIALCVKERDDSFTNIPLGIFMHNGYNDKDGNEAYACLPHSGLNVEIRKGPLLQHCSIQHYIAIQGVCCWNSNHNADVPWMRDIDSGQIMRGNQMLESIRVAAMEAIFFNLTGARFQLPHGGYGLTGVCNDSAAMIQYALSGKNDVYPLTLNGKYAMENLRSAVSVRDKLKQDPSMKKEVDAVQSLIKSLLDLPSDTNSLPSETLDQIRRCLHVQQPRLPFMLLKDNITILDSIQKEIENASR